MSIHICESCQIVLKFLWVKQIEGRFVKEYECPKCKSIFSFPPDSVDKEVFNG